MMPAAGRAFGPYEILEPIGAGGMGEVFKARDSRLNRIVAIKTSKDQFSDRFAGEARATAALNHPHIATLYDVGPDFLVMEYVDGEPLRGPLPVSRALQYARQILEALDAAHSKGVVHRDLKPANILISKTGGVKLLDFGLAQMKEIAPGGDATATVAMSVTGTIAGTLQYMAPEQLQGKPADGRSDIFAFGLVLYEMLTGRPAFEADNPASLITAIMSSEPAPLHDRLPSASPALERIFQICIAKDPDDRWQCASDIRRALGLVELAAAPAPAVVPTPSRRKVSLWYAAVPAFVLGGIALFLAMRGNRSESAPPWIFRPLTYSGRAFNPSLSPDGKQVAFRWTGENDNSYDLYVKLVSGGNPLRLKDTQPYAGLAWSPDGSQIAYQRKVGLFVIPALGGTSRRIATFNDIYSLPNVAWSPNGSYFILDGRALGLLTLPVEGGEPRVLTKVDNVNDTNPAIAPDGSAVAFVRRTSTFNSSVMLLPLTREGAANGDPQLLVKAGSTISTLDWTRDGKDILYQNAPGGGNSAIWRVSRKGGDPVRVNVPSMVAEQPATARQSDRMVFINGIYETKLFKLPVAAGKTGSPQPIVDTLGDQRDLAVSPDGSRVVFVSTRTGAKEIWIANADGSNQTQVTFFDGASIGSPQFSPDGTRIAFDGYASGSSDIYVVPVEGGKPARLTSDGGNEIRPTWSQDGKWIYFGWDRGGNQQVWKMPATGGDPTVVTHSGGHVAFETSDGQWLYVVNASSLYRVRTNGTEESPIRPNVYPNVVAVGNQHVYVIDNNAGQLLRAKLGTNTFEPVFTFDDSNRPICLGNCIGMPRDESYSVYRRTTQTTTALTLIDNFH